MARTYGVYGGFSGGHFTGGKSARGINVAIKDEITPVLTMLGSGVTKRIMASAAHSTAFTAMNWVKMAINRGWAEGFGKIPDRKTLDNSGAALRVLDKFKANKLKSGSAMSRRRLLFHLLHGKTRFGAQMQGSNRAGAGRTKSLYSSVNYARLSNNEGSVVGWGSKSSPYWGNAVQEGLRGRAFGMSFRVYQPFTERQRRFFAAIGLPIGKTNINMRQPPAAFFGPMMKHKERTGALGRVFNQKVDAAIRRAVERARMSAKPAGMAA